MNMMITSNDAIRTCRIMGVKIVEERSGTVISWIDNLVESGDRFCMAFANANLLNHARKQSEICRALDKFVVLNDGLGVDLANLIINGRKFPENLNGTDFVPEFLRTTRHKLRIFVLGAEPGVAEMALANLQQCHPQHEFVGAHHGYFPNEHTDSVIGQIRQSEADVLLVGFGNPKQELWLTDHLAHTGCKVGIAVGAFLDFSSGRVARAPEAIRLLRSEWLFRLLLEPGRMFKRYTWGTADFLLAAAVERYNGT